MISPRLRTTSSAPLTPSASPSRHAFLQLFVLPSCCELIQFLSTDKTSEFNVTMRQLNGNNNKKKNNNSATATTSITMATLAIIMDDAADPAPTSSPQKGVVCLGDSDSNLVSISLSNNCSQPEMAVDGAVMVLVPALLALRVLEITRSPDT